MKKQDTAFHGSDLEKIEEEYGIPKEHIISFSANVNPVGFSLKITSLSFPAIRTGIIKS